MSNYLEPSLEKGYNNFELRFRIYKMQRNADYPFTHAQIDVYLASLLPESSYLKAIELYRKFDFSVAGAYALKIMLDKYDAEFSDDYIFSALWMFLDILGQDLEYGKVKYSPLIQNYKSRITFENEVAKLIKINSKPL